MNELIINDDEIIGTVKTVVNYIKSELISNIEMIDLSDENLECDGVENLQDNLTLFVELLNGIYQDIITGVLNKNDKIKVYYNPMGAYYYEKIEKVGADNE